MENYTIEGFWKARLTSARGVTGSLPQGWQSIHEGLSTFKEAPLTRGEELGEVDPERAAILLVSAPGAVGKSTLARQIAHHTGSIYLNLAEAGPVGENTLSGGLARSALFESWQDGSTVILIDGLDEAKLRVTQEAFEAFLCDVAQLSNKRSVPTVLFGRTGAIEDTWLVLEDQDVETSVLEIGYYGPRDSVEFAQVRITATCSVTAHLDVQLRAIELLLTGLRERTEQDGDRFAGYAPVLIAVADTVANEANPGALVARIERGLQPVTLQSVVTAILDREQKKLSSLTFEDTGLIDRLYAREEQLDRLVARTYGTVTPSPGVPMNNNDRQAYEQALETWVPEHPFLGGGGNSRSAVFDAAVSAHALRSSQSADVALRRELDRGAAANPFLSVFYPRDTGTPVSEADSVELRPDHIGIVYASVRAGLALGDTANLYVVGRDDVGEDDEEALRADVEISVTRKGQERQPLEFRSEQTSAIRIGSHLAGADITVPYGTVEIGSGAEAVLMAPIEIECDKLV